MKRNWWSRTDKAVEAFEHVYPIVSRRYHDLLAWLVVVAGIGVAAGPVWEPYLRAAAIKYLNMSVEPPPNAWLGAVMIALGLAYHFFAANLESLREVTRGEATVAHDAALYSSLTKIISDDWFLSFLRNLNDDHSYYNSDMSAIRSVLAFFISPNKRFLFPELRGKANAIAKSLSDLSHFLAYRFFMWPPDQIGGDTRYCLQPWQNMDRGGANGPGDEERYAGWSDELDILVEAAKGAYTDFVRIAHERLRVHALDSANFLNVRDT
jgi:hypothetical protein